MRVSIVGLGYVGLVTSACLAKWGNTVIGIEADAGRVAALRRGELPVHEPGLDTLVASGVDAGLLTFETIDAMTSVVGNVDLVILAVGTHDGNGGWQTDTIRRALHTVVPHLGDDTVLAVRSTLPPEFVDQLPQIVTTLREEAGRSPVPVLLNPEFTREAHAVDDFLSPGRVVIGIGADPDAHGLERMRELYEPVSCPVLVMPAIDASFAKLGSNLFLATKISFANELATLCDAYGATVDNVVGALALDARIGGAFLGAGVGFGGSCLPHQVKMIVKTARQAGIPVPMLAAVDDINLGQRARVAGMLDDMLPGGLSGARIAVLGLTFKPDTDDLRDAPSLTVAQILLERGATVIAHDPMDRARTAAATMVNGLVVVDTAREALDGADAAVLLTEWREYRELDWSEIRPLLRGDVVLDGRNALDPQRVVDAGLRYASFGRGMRHPEPHALTSGEVAEPAWVEGVA